MKLHQVTLTNFRNYRKELVQLSDGIHFVVGMNGSGKTNFLESIYVLSLAKSYKTSDDQLILHKEEYAKIEGRVESQKRFSEMQVVVTQEGKTASINKSEQKRLSDYIGKCKIVSFLPEDMNIIKGSPRDRRYFFDIYLGETDSNYVSTLSKYKYVLKQRNELLKKMTNPETKDDLLMEVITSQLIQAAQEVIFARKYFIERINDFLRKKYYLFSNKSEPYEIRYIPSIDMPTPEFYTAKLRQDIFTQTTNYGPHRDDFMFLLNDIPALDYASQGEQRMMVLSLVMAISEYIGSIFGEYPIILLDDVFSELDSDKQTKLIQYLKSIEAQSIITTTSLHDINRFVLQNAKIFRVEDNHIKEDPLNASSKI